ncbi:SDR family oxidoreductase [Sphingosinicella sp. BN140058]|uniref:SDR family NAD(P)-dependent oxidoreductase n=1 Tax=Sphingosinicella sp. BN140058 TaxID=1892855 RepID=UPI0010123E8F|nr:SDR family NAD(P)-dependent oxidoreductase [Sphingosinicella sp. BN140058]QAY78226.1 SDR family NAD(P)-dependent oxidoreductase [Sphingosinicella sp. BN140058]
MSQPKLAIVTGASTGIGLELAKLAAQDGYDLVIAADTPLVDASSALSGYGVQVQNVEADLSTFEGVDRLLAATGGRQVDALFANAGHGLGHAFLDQDPADWRHVVDTNITGTVYLIQKVAKEMVARDDGRILITGSIAGHIAGAFQAVYNGTKAFIDSFSDALVNELKDTNVTITCLKPGATETEFFERAGMEDTKVGQAKKDDPADVAKTGYEALMKGDRSVIYGLKNKLQVAGASVLGGGVSAQMHRAQAEPGSGED